jgi:AcrR family transcriptional regulator
LYSWSSVLLTFLRLDLDKKKIMAADEASRGEITLVHAYDSSRSRISGAAVRIFVSEGFDGLSMRRIAEEVGMTATAIYRHFDNKEALIDEIVVAGLRVLEGYLQPALDAETPYERVRKLTDKFLEFALEQPSYFDVAFVTQGFRIERISAELVKPMWGVFRKAIAAVEACMEHGEVRKDDALSTAIMIWATAHGLVTLYRTGQIGSDAEQFRQLYRASMDRLFYGLRPACSQGEGAEYGSRGGAGNAS